MTSRRAIVVAMGVIGLALFAQSLWSLGLDGMRDGLSRVGVGFVAIVALSGARELVRTLAWMRTVDRRGQLPFVTAFRARLAGEALNTLLPMGMIAGEPVKASHVAPRLSFGPAFGALVIEFAFYCASLVPFFLVGAAAFMVASHVSAAWWALGAACAVIGGTAMTAVARAIRRAQSGHETTNAPASLSERVLRAVRQPFVIVRRFATDHPDRVRAIASFELAYHVFAVTETYLVLWLVSPVAPSLTMALVLETVNRAVTMIFKMLPMRVGVDEASASVFADYLDLGAATGITLALVRKLRMLFWSAVGLACLLAGRPRAADAGAPAWRLANQPRM